VLLRPVQWPVWESLELEGRVCVSGSSVRWSRWLDPPSAGESLELDLPYGLVDLATRLFPEPPGVGELAVELDELGIVPATRAALAEGTSTVLGDVLRAGSAGVAAGSAFRRMAWTVRETIDLAGYDRWFRMFETPSSVALEQVRARALSSGLRVSIVAAGEPDRAELEAQLPGRLEIVRSFGEARADIVVPLGPGVRLVPHALATLVCVFHRLPEVAMIHADHDRFEAGRRTDPDFGPVLGPELLRSRNLLRGVVAVRRDDAPAAAEAHVDDAGLYAWTLSAAAALPARRIRRLPAVLATLGGAAAADPAGERSVLSSHLRQTGVTADVLPGLAPGLHHVRYRLPDPAPRVSIVVPTRNARDLVETCVRCVRRLTRYPRYEIHLIDNGSDDPEALAAFETLARTGDVLLHRDPRPFNFSALNNAAVGRTDAEMVCLLNNDVEALHPEWLEEMVSVALQPGVGAVGAKLFYPDGRVQHGGVLVGLYGAADHAYAGAPGDAPGYAQQLLVRREVSAVTAACLVIRRTLYLEVGGLDEEAFGISFNDVDFCLKLRERGYRNVWTPHARLAHHESASRGKAHRPEQKARADRELAALRSRWADALLDDPYHSPNLSLDSRFPRLAWPPRERRPWSL
jgi:GT2 family glycosyltransferase